MIHNNYTMSIVSGSKDWQYFCKEKSSESATCKKVQCKNNVQRIYYKWAPSSLKKKLQNSHKELDLDMKRPHEDTGSEIGNVQRKMTMFVIPCYEFN